ncbi:hypothetical protein Pint_06462 [Pistacia integerrima]|uniref:Uncharacterized protein n=1 Tax=Pistacia integerrima TaxID=434235 RepID=A0ACC0Z8C9_9ROSI|nr:hypothetical protein Pint_06462 [Pistacia integerrima]
MAKDFQSFPFGVPDSDSKPSLSNFPPMTAESGSFICVPTSSIAASTTVPPSPFTIRSSASVPEAAMTSTVSAPLNPWCFGSTPTAVDNSRVFCTKSSKRKIKKFSRIRRQLSRSEAPPLSTQAPANQSSPFSFNNSSTAAISTTASPSCVLTNVAPAPAFRSSSVQSSSQTKSDYSDSSSSVEDKQRNATRVEANKEPVKNSPLPLTTVTRILNGIPQNPHFYQLRNCSELTRERLISTWDQIFEETVKEIHSLQDVDFWVRAKRLWQTMEELQNVGYNVIPLRRRLVELTDVMIELKLSQLEIKGLKIKAENHRMEKSRLDSLMVNLQALAKREEDCMESVLIEASRLENDLPKFGGVFTKLAMEPL